MGYPIAEIANQNFQAGADYLKSIANSARKAYCTYVAVDNAIPDVVDVVPAPLKALQEEFVRSICELPADPVPLPPPNRLPSNAGSCACQPYRVNFSTLRGEVIQETLTVDRLGPIGMFNRSADNPNDPTLRQVGITSRGLPTEPCRTDLRFDQYLQAGGSVPISIRLNSVVPVPSSTFVPCDRPTLPTDRRPPGPVDRPRPTVNIPLPNLPDIEIPVFPVPLPVLPNVKFEPKLVIDVGGINVEFTIGEVNFNFNPELNAPITIFPPGYGQPSLPPAVRPDPSPSGEDCCDEILAAIAEVDVQVRETDLRVQGVQDTANGIKQTQDNAVVPLLEDIKDCSCPPETLQVATFNNLQGYTYQDANTKLAFAQVNVLTTDIKKTWTVDGGKEVALVGWYAFGRSGRLGERRGLQFRNNLCLPEQPGMDEFTFGLYNGITANGTVHAEKTVED